MAVELKKPLSRLVKNDGVEFIVSLDEDGISLRLPGKINALKLSYKSVAAAAEMNIPEPRSRSDKNLLKMFEEAGLL
jgi:predicted aconitase